MKRVLSIASLFALGASLALCACERDPKEKMSGDGDVAAAKATVLGAPGSEISGSFALRQEEGKLVVEGTIQGLEPGKHGLHIHENGTCDGPDFKAAGEHFAPRDAAHGAPSAAAHHAGDLGNIVASDEGTARISIISDDTSLSEVVDRALIVHAEEDDYTTQPGGDAGRRIACAVITATEKE